VPKRSNISTQFTKIVLPLIALISLKKVNLSSLPRTHLTHWLFIYISFCTSHSKFRFLSPCFHHASISVSVISFVVFCFPSFCRFLTSFQPQHAHCVLCGKPEHCFISYILVLLHLKFLREAVVRFILNF